jgi:sugar-specific transcriptional regulator TrmB
MKKFEILNNLGFSEHEKQVYLFLLEHGAGSATEIETGADIPRPTVYKALEGLISKNIVSISPKGKRKIYSPAEPDKLSLIFKQVENSFLENIEDLYRLYEKGSSKKPMVSFAEGKTAISDSYMDIVESLPKNGKYYRYSSIEEFNRERYISKEYRGTRDKKGLERYIITNESTRIKKEKLGRVIKVVPKSFDLFEYNINQVIYGDKVSFIDFDSGNVITIQQEKFAEFQRKIFKLLFSKLDS